MKPDDPIFKGAKQSVLPVTPKELADIQATIAKPPPTKRKRPKKRRR